MQCEAADPHEDEREADQDWAADGDDPLPEQLDQGGNQYGAVVCR